MRKDFDRGAAEATAVDDTGVIELVRDHHVVFAQDRGNGSGVGGEAALKDNDGLSFLERGETALELHVDFERPRDRPYRSRADTVTTDGVQRALAKFRVGRESQVVVRGEVDAMPPVADGRGLLLVRQNTEAAEQALF